MPSQPKKFLTNKKLEARASTVDSTTMNFFKRCPTWSFYQPTVPSVEVEYTFKKFLTASEFERLLAGRKLDRIKCYWPRGVRQVIGEATEHKATLHLQKFENAKFSCTYRVALEKKVRTPSDEPKKIKLSVVNGLEKFEAGYTKRTLLSVSFKHGDPAYVYEVEYETARAFNTNAVRLMQENLLADVQFCERELQEAVQAFVKRTR